MSSEMIAVEFQTSIKNGTIEVPSEYQNTFTGTVRVIILAQEPRKASKIIHRLLENPIDDPSFTPFTRDEIYNDRTK
jgi:hypothetical protein